MTQEEEQLLIKEIRARLPYGVKGKTLGSKTCTLSYVGEDGSVTADTYHCWIGSKQFVPYLRPMNLMTSVEKDIYDELYKRLGRGVSYEMFKEFFYTHHLDWSGFIEKGLALPAPFGTYEIE